MIQLSRRTTAVFSLRSNMHALDVHFSGRTLVCPGKDCPVCKCERPRRRYYAAARANQVAGLVELPPSLSHAIFELLRSLRRTSAVGLVLELERPTVRSTWSILRTKHVDATPVPERQVIEMAALLFRLDAPTNIDNWPLFQTFAGEAHRPLLAKTVLFEA